MIELPEALALAKQLTDNIVGKVVAGVRPPTKPHKFCWFNGDPAAYEAGLRGTAVMGAAALGIFVELAFDSGKRLCFNDGVNVRLVPVEAAPRDYQLLIAFTDGSALVFTVAMYGGIVLHDGDYDNEYYLKSKNAVTVFDKAFDAYFDELLAASKPTLSAKAFLATEKRFPGLGNGVLQDILLAAGVHPKRKLGTMSDFEREELRGCVKAVLDDMTSKGGRDTEKDIFGAPGGYRTRLSQKTVEFGCPLCGGPIVKEPYLGGSVYYCPHCQPLKK